MASFLYRTEALVRRQPSELINPDLNLKGVVAVRKTNEMHGIRIRARRDATSRTEEN